MRSDPIASARHVQAAPRLSVRLVGLPDELALEAGQPGDHFRQVLDRNLITRAQVHRVRSIVLFSRLQDSLGGILDIKKFPGRRTVSPDHHFLIASILGFKEFANQGGNDMR